MKNLNSLLEEVIKLNKNKDYDQVLQLLTSEVLEKFNNSDLYAESAMAFWYTKKYEDCEKSTNKAFELNNKNAKALNSLGNLAFNSKEYEKAKEFYLKAIELDPNSFYAFNDLGTTYRLMEEYDKAIEFYLTAIKINPNFSRAYNNLGNVYQNLYDYDKAIEFYLKAIQIDQSYHAAYYNIGGVYLKQLEYEKAEEYYLKAINIDPKSKYGYGGLGIVYKNLNKIEKAEEFYLKAIELTPNYKGAFYNLGNLYFDLKEYEKAKANYNKFFELNGSDQDFYYFTATSKINEIDKILENSTFKKATDLVNKIKSLLKFKGKNVTHYTGITSVQFLVLKESPFRLSEGSFLNDTSEGQELFSFLDYADGKNAAKKCNKEIFTKRPFIGSFVDAEKNNDLTLWRMYGKEQLEEAKGCSITLNANDLIENIKNKICPDKEFPPSDFDDIDFYRVAYRNGNKFDFFGSTTAQKKELIGIMTELFEIINEFRNKPDKLKDEEKDIIELLNQIAYLFKSTEYKYENEIRLIIKDAIGFDIMVDFDKNDFKPSSSPVKVFIELVPIDSLLDKITLGPKVDKAEEWATTFYYHLANKKLFPEIEISTLPYK
jgi:tetratricopeptide (TPR) repeat protein